MADSTGRTSSDAAIREPRDSNGHVYVFENFELRTETCELFRSGRATGLQLKPTRLLLYLIEHRERTVPKEELLQAIWPHNYISESAFTSAIRHIRHALDEGGDSQHLIRTFRGRGYRFVGAVERHAIESTPEDTEAAETGPRSDPNHRRKGRRVRAAFAVAGGSALIVLIAALLLWHQDTEAPEVAPGLAFEERDWVLISSFENRTGETLFDGTLEHALQRTLVNSRFVNVVPRERIQDTLRLMKQPADARVDAALGREICLRDGGIRALLAGRAEKLGTTYVLSVRIVDPAQGVTVASLSEEAQGEDQVWPAIGRLASGVREALGEDLSRIRLSESKLAKVTTPSLRALRLYSEVDTLIASNKSRVAEQLLKQAIAADPEFASAYTALAWTLHNQDREYLPYAKTALELADQLPSRERYFIRASYFHMVEQDEETVANYEALLRLHPDHYAAINNLAAHLSAVGRYDEATRYVVRRAQLRPTGFLPNYLAYEMLSRKDSRSEGLSYLSRASETVSAADEISWPLWVARVQIRASYLHWLKGDLVAMQRELERWDQTLRSAKGRYRSALAKYLGQAHMDLGQRRKAGDYYRMSAKHYSMSYQVYRAHQAALRGEMARIPELFTDWESTQRTIHLAAFGFVDEARESLAKAEATLNSPDAVSPPKFSVEQLDFSRGLVAYAEERTGDAISLLESLTRREEEYRWLYQGYYSLPVASEILASAWLRQGNLGEAVRVLERAARDRSPWAAGAVSAEGWMRMQLRLAHLYRELGRTTEADEIEHEIRDLLAYADDDFWMVRYLEGGTTWDPRFAGWLHRLPAASGAAVKG